MQTNTPVLTSHEADTGQTDAGPTWCRHVTAMWPETMVGQGGRAKAGVQKQACRCECTTHSLLVIV